MSNINLCRHCKHSKYEVKEYYIDDSQLLIPFLVCYRRGEYCWEEIKPLEEDRAETCKYYEEGKTMKIKQMQYQAEKTKPELIHYDEFLGFEYYVCSLGTHPTAYIKINKENKYYGKDYSELDCINCHGGITYTNNYLGDDKEIVPESEDYWIIGWDYAHAEDYTGFYPDCMGDYKKWSTEEIIEEIEEVIQYLNKQQYPEDRSISEFAPVRLEISIKKILHKHGFFLTEDEILLETDLGLTRVILPEKYRLNDALEEEVRGVFPYTHEVVFEYQ